MPMPVAPQKWHFRQSIDYSVTANYSVFDVASRHREQFLYNIYKMGRNSIERGSRDNWTVTPKQIDAVRAAAEKELRPPSGPGPTTGDFSPTGAPGGLFTAARGGRSPVVPAKYYEMLREPAKRDPRGYILPSSQADFPTATKFINALQRSAVTVHPRDAGVQRGRQELPGGLVRGEDRAGVPPARARHVRAAGPPERLRVAGRPADPALRQRGLDARVPDGRRVRPHPRRLSTARSRS
jgi:hypothetical protein